EVVAMRGGYDYDFQRSVLNRVTQSRRQPGSAFKPVVYLAAIDSFGYTPSTIVYDERRTFRIGDQVWTPGNFDSKFLGPITLRTALQRSRNLVSADIISRIGVDAAINYARKLGIESPLGRNLSLSLGSSEVTLLELARAYGVFAARGVLFQSVFASKIVDRDGITTYDYNDHIFEAGKQAINANSAFIMAYMMKGVVEHGTGYRVRPLGRPTAGKTGTSNDQMDAWFIGYTPEWVCGVWTGFDLKKKIGEKETGGAVSAPTWLYAMQEFYEYEDKIKVERLAAESALEAQRLGIESEPVKLEPLDFTVPEGVDPFWVDKDSGAPAEAGSPNAIYEYFIRGTEPKRGVVENRVTEDYLGAGDL
ncbi:MAG: hypothetical protein KDD53_10360, partial [Bdellovibrionales bacterium]|nr:hypothetical protein [Bdellovibrionales bacterium]